jgi:hypothetical protein
MRQQRHTDFPKFNMSLNAPAKPNSTIVALCDNTKLHFYVGPDKQLVTVDMNAGDCCFFAGDVIHAGAEWEGEEPNFRLFMYWPTTDIFVPWTAASAAETPGLQIGKFRVAKKCYENLKLTTNPLSLLFELDEYNKYLYDFEDHSFYRYDTELYLQGIGANIDGFDGQDLVAQYSNMHVHQVKRAHGCPHFDMEFIDPKHLARCRKRCFYCMRHLRHIKTTASAQQKATSTPPCQRDNLSSNHSRIKRSIAKIRDWMSQIEREAKSIEELLH